MQKSEKKKKKSNQESVQKRKIFLNLSMIKFWVFVIKFDDNFKLNDELNFFQSLLETISNA
jgi:hypothetical protein